MHKNFLKPQLALSLLLLFAAACAQPEAPADPAQPAATTVAVSTNTPPGTTIPPTATATVEPANLVIGPETLGQVRLLWSMPGPTDNNPTFDCRPAVQACTLRTNTGGFAFSPDGSVLAVGICLGVRIWEQTVAGLEDHRCTAESAIILYDSTTGEERTRFAAATIPLSLAFHPDGTILAAGLSNNNVELWDLESGEVAATLQTGGKYFGVPTLAFTPDGSLLILSIGGGMQIWDWSSAKRLESILAVDGFGGISADSRQLTVLHYDSIGVPEEIHVYDLADPDNFSEFSMAGHPHPRLFYFNPVNGWLGFTGNKGNAFLVNFWDPATETLVASLQFDRDVVQTGVHYGLNNGGFTPDGYFLITRSGSLWERETPPPDGILEDRAEACGFALFDAQANQIFHLPVLESVDAEVEGQKFRLSKCYTPEYMYPSGLNEEARILSPDGSFIAGQDVDGNFYVWGVDPSQPVIPPECFGDC